MTNIKNIQPKLRFNGINYEISYLKLKSFSVVKCGKTPSTKNKLFWLNGTIPFVTPTDIINERINKTERFVTTDGWKKSQKAIKGSIFVTCVASIGKNSMCDTDSAFNQQINNIYSNIYNNKFLYYLMNKNEQLIKSKASKSATQIIKKSDFENIEFYLTTNLEEQTKIANFFTLLDKQIQLIERKLELYELRKKYYLNNIFCDDYSNLPKLRFEGFEEKLSNNNLNEICKITKGDQINNENLTNNGKYYYLNGGLKLSGWTDNFNRLGNTISISEGGEYCGFVNYNQRNFWSGGHLYTLDNLEDKIDTYFLFSVLKYKQKSIMRLRVGTGLPNIQKPSLSKINIIYPKLEEQTKIANLFSSLEEGIQNLKKQKDQLTKRKTYYLNNMFL